jgi:hypothetical protein
MKKIALTLSLSVVALLCVPTAATAQQLTCESHNYQQEFCPTGVQISRAWMVAQRSRSPCIEGQTWGFQGNGIWVSQGCEADFAFQGAGGPPVVVAQGRPGANRITCESRNYQQQYCPTGQQISNAWVIEQRSGAPCIQGQTWGYQNNDIWVTQGCAADFGVQGYGGPPVAVAPLPMMPAAGSIICESRDYQQQFCATGRPVSRAWLVNQRSRSACIQGRSWGYDESGIWVTQGCEGQFAFE